MEETSPVTVAVKGSVWAGVAVRIWLWHHLTHAVTAMLAELEWLQVAKAARVVHPSRTGSTSNPFGAPERCVAQPNLVEAGSEGTMAPAKSLQWFPAIPFFS